MGFKPPNFNKTQPVTGTTPEMFDNFGGFNLALEQFNLLDDVLPDMGHRQSVPINNSARKTYPANHRLSG